MDGKIGNYTYADLLTRVRGLGQKARTATKDQANALLPEAHELIHLIRDELLARDHAELTRHRAAAHAAGQQIEARYAYSDQAREAAQAHQMNELQRQLDQAKAERSELGLWTRITTSDDKSKAVEAQIDALEARHDQQDQLDARAKGHEVGAAFANVQPFENEAAGTQAVLDEAQGLVTHLMNRASGWGEGSDLFRRIDGITQFAMRANANDMDAKGYMAVTAALFGRSIEDLNNVHLTMRQINQRLHYRHKLTDVEALAVLACASVAANVPPDQVAATWASAIDHARRVGGFSDDEDARALVVFCACVTRRNVEDVQSERRGINVDNFQGRDPEGAGMLLLTYTICGRPIHDLVQAYCAAGSSGMPMEERSYMSMACGLGNKPPQWAIERYRGLQSLVRQRVQLPTSWEAERDAIRETAATLTIAAAISSWRDEQLIELFNRTASFKPMFGAADYESRGSLVIGACAPSCKL